MKVSQRPGFHFGVGCRLPYNGFHFFDKLSGSQMNKKVVTAVLYDTVCKLQSQELDVWVLVTYSFAQSTSGVFWGDLFGSYLVTYFQEQGHVFLACWQEFRSGTFYSFIKGVCSEPTHFEVMGKRVRVSERSLTLTR